MGLKLEIDPDGTEHWVDDGIYEKDPGVILDSSGAPTGGSGTGGATGGTNPDGTPVVGGVTGAPASTGIDWSKLLNKAVSTATTPAGIAALGTLIGSLSGMNKPSAPPGYSGPAVDPNKYAALQTQIAQPAYKPYSGEAVMGRKQLSDMEFTPTTHAAQGGLMGLPQGLARGGQPKYLQGNTDGMADEIATKIDGHQDAALSHGEFIIPADVVSHLGNGNSDAGANVLYKMMDRVRHARTGNKKQGKQIDPNKFTPGGIAGYAGGGPIAFAGVGTSLVPTTGQGGANSLPVTQSTNLASWAGKGVTDYIERGTALARAPYQTYTGPLTAGTSPLQQKAFTAASNLGIPASVGQASATIGDAATKMGNLSYTPTVATSQYAPTATYTGTNNANQYTGTAAYDPTVATNQYQSTGAYNPAAVTNQYTGTAAYDPIQASSQYQGTGAYNGSQASNQYTGTADYKGATIGNQYKDIAAYTPTTATSDYKSTAPYNAANISTDKFDSQQLQDYINPYLRASLDPQLAEARRQSEISQQGNAAKATAAGAFGGSRAALMQSETQRNLGTNLANITGQGYNTAYTTAQAQFNADQARQMQAQQGTEASRQFGATQAQTNAQQQAQYGGAAQALNAQQKQFASSQALANAQNAAQYGLAGLNATEASRQFGASQALSNAQSKAQYGNAAQLANIGQQQFGANLALSNAQNASQAAQAAQALNVNQQQFGANQAQTNAQQQAQYGQAAQTLAAQQQQFGANQALSNAQNLATSGQAAQALNVNQQQFGANQALSNAQNTAQYGLAGLNANEASRQFGANQALSNAQNISQAGQAAQAANIGQQQFGATYGLQSLQGQMQAGQAQGNLGVQQNAMGLANLNAQTAAGATERGIEQEGIAALQAQFEAERQDPYKKLQFEQSLYSGLPVSNTTASTATTPMNDLLTGAGQAGNVYTQINDLLNPKPAP